MALHVWESPSDGKRVFFGEPVVRSVRLLAIDGFVALRRRGLEVGGLLLGAAHEGDVRIEAFREVPCEHRYGPSYVLSESDRAKLGQMLAEPHCANVVGFFRSFTLRDPVIEEADGAMVREFFPSGDFVYLMIQPLSAEECVASIRLFHDGQLVEGEIATQFAFDPRRMPVVEVPLEVEEQPQAIEKPELPPLPPAYRKRDVEPRPAPVPAWASEPAPPRRPRVWLTALVCLMLGAGAAVVYELWLMARAPRWTELHLDARPVGGRLEVSWDANAPSALDATRAVLAVTDGDTHRDLALDASQLRSGKYTFSPAHRDVALRMILYSAGVGVSGDAVRLESSAAPPAAEPPAVVPKNEADRIAVATEKSAVVVPPSTIHEVQPTIPEGVRSRLTDRVVIPVEVEVSERGRVVRAVAEDQGDDSVRRYLAEQAVKSAREWRFMPARTKGGGRVAATKTIHFVFNP